MRRIVQNAHSNAVSEPNGLRKVKNHCYVYTEDGHQPHQSMFSMLFNTCLVYNHKHLHVHKTLLSERHTDRFEASTHMIWGVHDIVMKKQPQRQIPLCSSCWLACSARHSFLAASIAGLQTYSRLLGFSQCGSF